MPGQSAGLQTVLPPSRGTLALKLKTLALSAPFRLLWTLALFIGANAVLDWLGIASAGNQSGPVTLMVRLMWVVRNAVVALAVFWVSVRLLEGRRLREAGLDPRRAPEDLAVGFGMGAAIISAVVGALALAGAYRIQGIWPLEPGMGRPGLFGLAVVGLFLVGLSEEVRSRGIFFRLLEQNLGTWVALGLSALLFGFGHWKNPGATVWSSLAIAIEGGVLLAALYAATRSLWVPIGVHWGWNLFEGPVWGTAVSGNSVGVLAQGASSGPSWLTGGAFGPEAGIPALIVGAIAGLLAVAWMVRRGEVTPGPWARSPLRPPEPANDAPGPPTGAPVPARNGSLRPGA